MTDQVSQDDGKQAANQARFDDAFALQAPEVRQALTDRTHRSDVLLLRLVQLVNTRNASLGVTLSVGGHLVSGQMVSIEKYFDSVAGSLGALEDATFRQSMQDWFNTQRPSPDDDNPMSLMAPNYIHLIDARYLTGSQWTPTLNGTPLTWRGKIASVDGFTIGSLKVT